jgi:hypothetical protein
LAASVRPRSLPKTFAAEDVHRCPVPRSVACRASRPPMCAFGRPAMCVRQAIPTRSFGHRSTGLRTAVSERVRRTDTP